MDNERRQDHSHRHSSDQNLSFLAASRVIGTVVFLLLVVRLVLAKAIRYLCCAVVWYKSWYKYIKTSSDHGHRIIAMLIAYISDWTNQWQCPFSPPCAALPVDAGSDIRGAGGSHTADAGRALRHSPYVVSYLRCVSMATRSFPFAHRMWLAVSSPAVLPHIDPSTCMSTPEYVVVLCSQSSYPGSSRFTLRTHPAHSRDPSYA